MGPILTGEGASRRFGHSGFNQGFMCNFLVDVSGKQGVVVMTNANEGYSLLTEIIHTIAAIYHWPDYERPQYARLELTPAAQQEYLGRFSFTSGGLTGGLSFDLHQDYISCAIEAGFIPCCPALPIDTDTFVLTESPHTLKFRRDDSGKIAGVSFFMEGVEIWTAEKTTQKIPAGAGGAPTC